MTSAPVTLHMHGAALDVERAVMIDAGRQLAACVSAATGGECIVELSFAPPAAEPATDARIVVASLLGEVASDEPVPAVAQRWDAWLERLLRDAPPLVAIGTVFRHVADPARRPLATERIRRLNDVAIALSRRHGVEIADIDRIFALLGAAAVRSDYRCAGAHAALLAGHVIVSAILAGDLSAHLPASLQERAQAAHGTLGDLINRHRQDAS